MNIQDKLAKIKHIEAITNKELTTNSTFWISCLNHMPATIAKTSSKNNTINIVQNPEGQGYGLILEPSPLDSTRGWRIKDAKSTDDTSLRITQCPVFYFDKVDTVPEKFYTARGVDQSDVKNTARVVERSFLRDNKSQSSDYLLFDVNKKEIGIFENHFNFVFSNTLTETPIYLFAVNALGDRRKYTPLVPGDDIFAKVKELQNDNTRSEIICAGENNRGSLTILTCLKEGNRLRGYTPDLNLTLSKVQDWLNSMSGKSDYIRLQFTSSDVKTPKFADKKVENLIREGSGSLAVSIGAGGEANGAGSVALGTSSPANGEAELTIGKYSLNEGKKNPKLIRAGWGSKDSRKDVFTVDQAGNVNSAGYIADKDGNKLGEVAKKVEDIWYGDVEEWILNKYPVSATDVGTEGTNYVIQYNGNEISSLRELEAGRYEVYVGNNYSGVFELEESEEINVLFEIKPSNTAKDNTVLINYFGIINQILILKADNQFDPAVKYNVRIKRIYPQKINKKYLDTEGYIKNTDYATSKKAGIVKIPSETSGLTVVRGDLRVNAITDENSVLDTYLGHFRYHFLSPSVQHISTFAGLAKAAGYDFYAHGLTNLNQIQIGTYPDEAKTAIKKMLGITEGGGAAAESWDLIDTIDVAGSGLAQFNFAKVKEYKKLMVIWNRELEEAISYSSGVSYATLDPEQTDINSRKKMRLSLNANVTQCIYQSYYWDFNEKERCFLERKNFNSMSNFEAGIAAVQSAVMNFDGDLTTTDAEYCLKLDSNAAMFTEGTMLVYGVKR